MNILKCKMTKEERDQVIDLVRTLAVASIALYKLLKAVNNE